MQLVPLQLGHGVHLLRVIHPRDGQVPRLSGHARRQRRVPPHGLQLRGLRRWGLCSRRLSLTLPEFNLYRQTDRQTEDIEDSHTE
jgi:hypothetical protein